MGRIRAERDTRAKPGLCQSPPALAGECFLNGMECFQPRQSNVLCLGWSWNTDSGCRAARGRAVGLAASVLGIQMCVATPSCYGRFRKGGQQVSWWFGRLETSYWKQSLAHSQVGTPPVSPSMTHKYSSHAPCLESIVPQIKHPEALWLMGMKAVSWERWDDDLPDPETLVRFGCPGLYVIDYCAHNGDRKDCEGLTCAWIILPHAALWRERKGRARKQQVFSSPLGPERRSLVSSDLMALSDLGDQILFSKMLYSLNPFDFWWVWRFQIPSAF